MNGIYNNADGWNIPRFLVTLNHQIAWRFIASAVMISPFILLVIGLRGKFSPKLRSALLGACFLGLFLPFQRSAFYFFDSLYPFVRKAAKAFAFPQNGIGPYDIFEVISLLWLLGFVAFFVARNLDYSKALRLFREGKLQNCASYFYRFRSRIYLPPEFERVYSPSEREMILAHERQHIAQHDPLLYLFLAILQCACWFNPLVSVALKHFQHERELLCDERVTRRYPKHDYGLLILKAAEEKKDAVRAGAAGIVMEFGSVSERVRAMIEPAKTVGRWAAAAVICLALLMLSLGFMGFRSAWMTYREFPPGLLNELSLREIGVYHFDSMDDFAALKDIHIDGMEAFVEAKDNRISVTDRQGMYHYAMSLGLAEESWLAVSYVDSIRPSWGAGNISTTLLTFQIKNLLTEEQALEIQPNEDVYTILTDVFF